MTELEKKLSHNEQRKNQLIKLIQLNEKIRGQDLHNLNSKEYLEVISNRVSNDDKITFLSDNSKIKLSAEAALKSDRDRDYYVDTSHSKIQRNLEMDGLSLNTSEHLRRGRLGLEPSLNHRSSQKGEIHHETEFGHTSGLGLQNSHLVQSSALEYSASQINRQDLHKIDDFVIGAESLKKMNSDNQHVRTSSVGLTSAGGLHHNHQTSQLTKFSNNFTSENLVQDCVKERIADDHDLDLGPRRSQERSSFGSTTGGLRQEQLNTLNTNTGASGGYQGLGMVTVTSGVNTSSIQGISVNRVTNLEGSFGNPAGFDTTSKLTQPGLHSFEGEQRQLALLAAARAQEEEDAALMGLISPANKLTGGKGQGGRNGTAEFAGGFSHKVEIHQKQESSQLVKAPTLGLSVPPNQYEEGLAASIQEEDREQDEEDDDNEINEDLFETVKKTTTELKSKSTRSNREEISRYVEKKEEEARQASGFAALGQGGLTGIGSIKNLLGVESRKNILREVYHAEAGFQKEEELSVQDVVRPESMMALPDGSMRLIQKKIEENSNVSNASIADHIDS